MFLRSPCFWLNVRLAVFSSYCPGYLPVSSSSCKINFISICVTVMKFAQATNSPWNKNTQLHFQEVQAASARECTFKLLSESCPTQRKLNSGRVNHINHHVLQIKSIQRDSKTGFCLGGKGCFNQGTINEQSGQRGQKRRGLHRHAMTEFSPAPELLQLP